MILVSVPVQLLERLSHASKLLDDVFNQSCRQYWLRVLDPEISQISSVGPKKHQAALSSSCYCSNALDEVGMAQVADFIQCVNFRLPYILCVLLKFFIIRGYDELLDSKFG
jgi:hypothetical protein